MPFTEEHRVLTKHYRLKKKYGRKELLKESPEKNWSKTGLRNLLNKIDVTGDTNVCMYSFLLFGLAVALQKTANVSIRWKYWHC